jgi:hypothetical protein
MGLDKAQKYLQQRQIHQIGDWGSAVLDAEGLALQAELEQRQTVRPLLKPSVAKLLTRSDASIAHDQVIPHLFGGEA